MYYMVLTQTVLFIYLSCNIKKIELKFGCDNFVFLYFLCNILLVTSFRTKAA